MNQLVIKLTGTVNASNFDEWKKDLIFQIQSTNRELATDDDFVAASEQVKSFKLAENSLKQAKQSAIDQAEEIQQLFLAIDEVTEEARQARLSLERQIKTRKIEIKNQCIQVGIDEIQSFIDEQLGEFQCVEKTGFLNRSRFESAVSGRSSTKGLHQAMEQLCNLIKREVSDKAIKVANNKAKIDALPTGYKMLFQDIDSLLGFDNNVLDLEIDKRIARYNEETAKNEAEQQARELKKIEDAELNPENTTTVATEITQKEQYQVVIDILSTKDIAKEIAQEIKLGYGDNPNISEIRLTRKIDH